MEINGSISMLDKNTLSTPPASNKMNLSKKSSSRKLVDSRNDYGQSSGKSFSSNGRQSILGGNDNRNRGDDGRNKGNGGRNEVSDGRNDSILAFSRQKLPPSMKHMGNSFESRRNMSSAQSSYSLNSSMSFDSVMKYPPSKLTPARRKSSSAEMNANKLGSRKDDSTIEEERDQAETNELDYPVFSNYQNVLSELQQEQKYRRRRRVSESTHLQKKDCEPSKDKDEVRIKRLTDHLKSIDTTHDKRPHFLLAQNGEKHHRSIDLVDEPIVGITSSSLVHNTNNFNSQRSALLHSHGESSSNILPSSQYHSDKEDVIAQLAIKVPAHGPSNTHEIDDADLSIHKPKSPSNNTRQEKISDKRQGRSSLLREKSRGKKVIAKKKMSTTKSKSIRRLFKSQDDRSSKPKQERRRNFAFMKTTPSRRKVSTATLERIRARAKQLAEFALTPDTRKEKNEDFIVEKDFFALRSTSLDHTVGDDESNHVGLNFDELDNESIISGMSSVNDLDLFDERSVYSSTSHFGPSRRKTPRSRKNRVESFGSSSRRQPQHNVEMFEANFDNAFHPLNMKKKLEAQNSFSASSETGSMVISADIPSFGKSQRSSPSSGASVVSTSSSVTGAAARRLMRRGMNPAHHNCFGSNDSVTSERSERSERSQYSGRHEQSDRVRANHGYNGRGHRPPTSPVPFMARDTSGFTFNAFGLDEHEIDDNVNAAIAGLAETDPDISFFMNSDYEDFQSHKDGSKGTASTNSMTASSNRTNHQPQHVHTANQSISLEREVSVSSTLSKSSDCDNMNAQGKSKGLKHSQHAMSFDRTSHNQHGKAPTLNIGSANIERRNIQTLRDVKERIKAKQQNSSGISALHNKFQSIDLPDIEPRDSEDSQETHMQKNVSKFKADFSQLDSAPSDEFGRIDDNNAESSRNSNQHCEEYDNDSFGSRGRTHRGTDQNTISSEDTDSSKEVTHFISRNARKPQDGIVSESQKRAQTWASERCEPIVISPLLVPSSGRLKKITSSQRRANNWARESPGSAKVKALNAEQHYREQHHEENNHRISTQDQQSLPSRRSLTHRPPKAAYDHNSFEPSIERETPGSAKVKALNAEQHYREQHHEENNHRISTQDQQSLPSRRSLTHRPLKAAYDHNSFEPSIDDEVKSTSFESEDIEVQEMLKPKLISRIGQQLPIPTEKIVLRRTESPVLQPDYEQYKFVAPKVSLRKVKPNAPKSVLETPNFLSSVKLRKVSTPTPRVEHDAASSPCTEDIETNGNAEESYDHNEEAYHRMRQLQKSATILNDVDLDMELCDLSDKRKQRANMVKHEDFSGRAVARQSPRDSYSSPPARSPAVSESVLNRGSTIAQVKVLGNTEKAHSHTITKEVGMHQVSHLPFSPIAAIFEDRSKDVAFSNDEDELKEIVSPKSEPDHQLAMPISARDVAETKRSNVERKATPVSAGAGGKAQSPDISVQTDTSSMNPVAALFAQRSAMIASLPTNEEPEEDNGKLLRLFSQRSSVAENTKAKPDINFTSTSENTHTAEVESESALLDFGGKPALKNDPVFEKYFKMLKMGLPLQVVKHALTRDGFDAEIMDGDHNKPAGLMPEPDGIPLKDDPHYTKYFKMFKMGLPMGAVKNAMARDGEDPSVMDGDHNAPAQGGSKQQTKKAEPLPKDKFRRTRVHWDTLEKVKATSIWAMVNEDPDIEIDESEFAELFQAEVGQTIAIDPSSSKKSNAVKVIDPKRANNGGIVLARLKITYEEMAVAIDTINDKVMNIEQVQGILEYIPTKDEKHALRKYMTLSDKDSADAFDDLCECEKFMVAMMTVKHSKEKVRALLFKLQFRQCVNDLESDVSLVEKACDELKESVRLRKILGIVLNIGNRLNTAGPTKKGKAGAFTIDSLLKLNQAKAFDKKTTFLHYIVLVVLRHDAELADFKDDLHSVLKADKIYWDQIENDLEEVENQLENVRKIALHEVLGKRRPRKRNGDDDDISQNSMSLEDEVEALRSSRIGIFTLQAIKIVSALRENVEITRSKFKKVLEYFGEDEKKKMNPHDLFDIICVFAKDFSTAKEAVIELEKVKARNNRKKQGVRSQSPSSRSRDSSWSKTSKEQDGSVRSEKALKASPMPHITSKVIRQQQKSETKDDSRSLHDSYYSNESSAINNERDLNRSEEETSHDGTSFSSEKMSHNEPSHNVEEHDENQEWANDEEDAEHQIPNETFEIDMRRNKRQDHQRHQAIMEEKEEIVEPDPFNAVRSRSVYDSHIVKTPDTNTHHEEHQERLEIHDSHANKTPATIMQQEDLHEPREIDIPEPDAQSMRIKARAMRQQRMRNVRQSPTPTARRPPTPETMGQSIPSPSAEKDSISPRERLMSRRERLARRQRHLGH